MPNNFYIGIDPSQSSTGICVLNSDGELCCSMLIEHKERKDKKLKDTFGCFTFKYVDILFESNKIKSENYEYRYGANPNISQIEAYYKIFHTGMNAFFERLFGKSFSPHDAVFMFGVEMPFGGAHRGTAVVNRIFAIIIRALLQLNIGIFNTVAISEVNPQTIKRFITGKGNVSKALVLKEVYKKFGYDTDIDDLADAYAIAKYVYVNNK